MKSKKLNKTKQEIKSEKLQSALRKNLLRRKLSDDSESNNDIKCKK